MILKIRSVYWREVMQLFARSGAFGVVGFIDHAVNRETTAINPGETYQHTSTWKKMSLEELLRTTKDMGSVSPTGY